MIQKSNRLKTAAVFDNFIAKLRLRTVIFVAISLLFSTMLVRNILFFLNAESRIDEAKKELREISELQEELLEESEKVLSESYKEIQARDKLGLAKEGEIVVYLPEESELKKYIPRVTDYKIAEDILPNWQKWFNLFVN